MSNIIRTMFSLCAIEGLQTHSRVFALRSPCRASLFAALWSALARAVAECCQSKPIGVAVRLDGAHGTAGE